MAECCINQELSDKLKPGQRTIAWCGLHKELHFVRKKGGTMKTACCNLEPVTCTSEADVTICSESGEVDACRLHIYELLEPGENKVYPVEASP